MMKLQNEFSEAKYGPCLYQILTATICFKMPQINLSYQN